MTAPRSPSAGSDVRVQLLGTTGLSVGEQALATGGPKLRAILASLALAGGRIVSVEDLLDRVWGEDLPNTARNTLQYHVGVLRKALAEHGAADALITRDPGYALNASTDVAMFLSLSAEAERLRTTGEHTAAAAALTEALNLWSGQAMADLQEFEFAATRAVALAEQRLNCVEAWADVELAAGRAETLIQPLQDLVTENPTRERLWEQLMIALYRTGRQDAALSAYRSARVALDRELGIDPSARLAALQTAILNHDPKLAPMPALRSVPFRPVTQTILARSELVSTPPTLVGPSGLRVELGQAAVIIGRHEDCDLMLLDDQASRQHAQVSPAGNGYVVEDLGSTNGTRVNGALVEDLVGLRDGDRIEIGHSVVRFVARG